MANSMTIVGITCPRCRTEFAADSKENAMAIAAIRREGGCYVESYSDPGMDRLNRAAANVILETAVYGEAH